MGGYWIQLEEGFRDHPKIFALAKELSISEALARGLLVSLWLWSITNALSGELTHYTSRAIARAADWNGNCEKFVQALVTCGWVDKHEDGRLILHGWVERVELLIKTLEFKREQWRLRQQHVRERRKAHETDCKVTRDNCVSHGITKPNQRIDDDDDITTHSDARACEGIENDEGGVDGEDSEAVMRSDFKAIYQDVLGLQATPEELEGCLRFLRMGSTFELVEEAFMRAARYHAKNPFPFAAECLDQWRKAGITTPDEAAQDDYDRDSMNGKQGPVAQKEAFDRVRHRSKTACYAAEGGDQHGRH